MRIAVAQVKQESNSFSTQSTTIEDFQNFHYFRGQEVLNLRGSNTEMAGFLDCCEAAGVEILPTIAAFAISGGPLTEGTYQELKGDLIHYLQLVQPFDGVLLSLHGSMLALGDEDPDGTTLQEVRRLIGDIPLVVTKDLHAKVSRKSVQNSDVIVGFKTSPHVDQARTGERAAGILLDWLKGKIEPVMAYAKIPMVTPASTHVHSFDGPFKRLMDETVSMEKGGALSASVFTVQPWLDVSEMGFSTIVVTDRDPALAQSLACRLAGLAWNERTNFMKVELIPPQQAIQEALETPKGPVVLSDLADGTGAGSPGDSTAVLEALLEIEPDRKAFLYVCDPEVARSAARLGEGATIDVEVGGKKDTVFSRPFRFSGQVVRVRRAAYRFEGKAYSGISMDMGLSAVLRRGEIYLLVSSNPVFTTDPVLYRTLDLEPLEAQIVVVKSHIQFRSAYEGIATKVILLDTPGVSSDRLEQLPFRNLPSPLFPFDRDFEYCCKAEIFNRRDP